jgi:predicted nuclease with RNAse H fold
MGMPERGLCFVGVDLAWGVDPAPLSTGFSVLDENGALIDWKCLTSDAEIVGEISARRPSWVAIDASLRVPNQAGMRDVERLLRQEGVKVLPTSRSFLKKHCGGSRGETVVSRLEPLGFALEQGGMPLFETFPRAILHAALGKLPRYKTGGIGDRSEGCAELARRIEVAFPALKGNVVSSLPADPRRAADMLDALACAICVYSHWRYGGERTKVLHGEDGTHVLLLREHHD